MTSTARLSDHALHDIQGIITSGYGHLPYAAYFFVSMTNPGGARRWLSEIAGSITSSHHRIVGHGLPEDRPPVAVNIGLTAEGLRAAGLPAEVIQTFPVEFQDGIASEERSRILGDTGASAPQAWEVGGPLTDPVHAMLMLFAADESALDELCRVQRGLLEASGGAVELPGSVQRGYRPDTFTEPFGFHDGIAQPSIAGLTGHGVPTGEFILGYENHYGLIPPTPVVPAQMNRARTLPQLDSPYHTGKRLGDLGRNGSYLVYRKLQQDVAGFWQFMARESARHGDADPARMVWLASKCVGRWPSGAPLTLAPEADDPGIAERDDFFYRNDPDGLRCPIGAHIRRTNPRDMLKPYPREQSLSMTEAHRLLRRGRTYGPPLFEPRLLQQAHNSDLLRTLAILRQRQREEPVRIRPAGVVQQPALRRSERQSRPADEQPVCGGLAEPNDHPARWWRTTDESVAALRHRQGRRLHVPSRPDGASVPRRVALESRFRWYVVSASRRTT
jgi:deferrochelatase/peroxidase EfeB